MAFVSASASDRSSIKGLICGAALIACTVMAIHRPVAALVVRAGSGGVDPMFAQRCAALRGSSSLGIDTAVANPAGPPPVASPMAPPLPPRLVLPAHCEVTGTLDRRDGVGGQVYAIRYHLRMPENWNGRFFFQGGGGLDGELGDALGPVGAGRPPALALGYAVVSQDSGHDAQRNVDPAHGGNAVFGTDPVARANYGATSLQRVADVAKAALGRFYGQPPVRSYFFGCSKGGQEGMAFAQRYPAEFDGIVAASPGFALPRAALAQAWDVQTYGRLVAEPGRSSFDWTRLASAFTDPQLALVRRAVLDACDRLDGLADGIVERFDRCTTARVLPALGRYSCRLGESATCLSSEQIAALVRSLGGPRTSDGQTLYATFPWDGGIGAPGWRLWKLGMGTMPALNIVTGAPALASVFSVPAVPLRASPQAMVDYQTHLDMTRGASQIYATDAQFPRSAWTDISARSSDLTAFQARGGKMIVPHGASDPVFSIADTVAWYRTVQARTGGQAASFVRMFPVPGMNHCGGGPATESFDAFGALVAWVEQGRAPDRIEASAGPASPWPGRTRPLCPFPKVAVYSGHGSIEQAANFICS